MELFVICGFEVIFCFNSKPNFSFESTGQHTSFLVTSDYRCNRRKDRFRVKTSLPQNCELKQEERRVGLELFVICGFEVIFCFNSKPSFSHPTIFFNSKPSFSFESWRQRNNFPVASASRFKRRKNRFRVKDTNDACFDLQFCHCHLFSHIPQIVNTNNWVTTCLPTSKLWVKTRRKMDWVGTVRYLWLRSDFLF